MPSEVFGWKILNFIVDEFYCYYTANSKRMQWLQAKLPKLTLWKIAVAGQIVISHYLGKSKIFLVWSSLLKVRKLAPFIVLITARKMYYL